MSFSVPDFLRSSGADRFEQCPSAYIRNFNETEVPASHEMRVGTLFHKILEQVMSHPSQDRNFELFSKIAWTAVIVDHVDSANNTMVELSGHIANYRKLEDAREVEVRELEYYFELEDFYGIPFKGTIDRVAEHPELDCIITDYKTGRKSDKHMRQVNRYAAAYGLINNILPGQIECEIIYTRYPGEIMRWIPSRQDLQDAVDHLKKVWAKIVTRAQENHWETKTSHLCGWCQFLDSCQAGQKAVAKLAEQNKLSLKAPAYSGPIYDSWKNYLPSKKDFEADVK